MRKIDKVLIVDDDEINNFINIRLIKKLGITDEIKVFKDGKEAYDYILDKCYKDGKVCCALVLLDHNMPVMDGIEFMKAYSKLPIKNREDMVFVHLGTVSKKVHTELFEKLGVEEFTMKPLREEVILEIHQKYWESNKVCNS
ncbi:MAG TPA: response regulator [Cytophagales bacterium]|nr:response regulator [Cytophagales bacterium]